GLVPGGEIDDRETTHAEADLPIDEVAFVIGATCAQCIAHRAHFFGQHALAMQSEYSCYTAHILLLGYFRPWPSPRHAASARVPSACRTSATIFHPTAAARCRAAV